MKNAFINLLAAAAILAGGSRAMALPAVQLGPGSSVNVAPGGTFVMNVILNAPSDFNGLSLYLQSSSANFFTVVQRTGATWSGNGLTDPITADSSLATYVLPASGNSADFGYSAGTVTQNIPASGGPYSVESITFSVPGNAAAGPYTITPTSGVSGSCITNASFDETDLSSAQVGTYTVDVVVPEPGTAAILAVGAVFLARRRRNRA